MRFSGAAWFVARFRCAESEGSLLRCRGRCNSTTTKGNSPVSSIFFGRRLVRLWSVEELDACFVVRNHNAGARRPSYLPKMRHGRIAANIAKLPELIARAKNVPASIDARDVEEN